MAAQPPLPSGPAPVERQGAHGRLGRLGTLSVRLAADRAERQAAQALRYRVFQGEMGAPADALARRTRRDSDGFDALCDHLLVLDGEAGEAAGRPAVIGTVRLLRGTEGAGPAFYSADAFDLAPLLSRRLRLLELGRACIDPAFRGARAVELLWHGIWAYALAHRIEAMFGCASLSGADPAAHAPVLGLLAGHVAPEPGWRVEARPGRGVPLAGFAAPADARAARRALPPLLKGYLRLGAMLSPDAVADPAFGTTDVLVVLPVSAISARHRAHYGEDAGRYAR